MTKQNYLRTKTLVHENIRDERKTSKILIH